MDARIAQILIEANSSFYRENASSFSTTRRSPWEGWERCARTMDTLGVLEEGSGAYGFGDGFSSAHESEAGGSPIVFDLACGNQRFERFMIERFPRSRLSFWLVDNCPSLVGPTNGALLADFREFDVCGELVALDRDFQLPRFPGRADVSVSFGFLHHVPGFENRLKVMESLLDQTRPGGLVCVSLWRFLDNAKMAAKARRSTEAGLFALGLDSSDLDPCDCILGWQGSDDAAAFAEGAFRYCHHFSEEEVDRLAGAFTESGRAELADRFRSDGRDAQLNEYLVLRAL